VHVDSTARHLAFYFGKEGHRLVEDADKLLAKLMSESTAIKTKRHTGGGNYLSEDRLLKVFAYHSMEGRVQYQRFLRSLFTAADLDGNHVLTIDEFGCATAEPRATCSGRERLATRGDASCQRLILAQIAHNSSE
jgi:hypothetical protein